VRRACLLLSLALAAGCVTGARLRDQIAVVQADAKQARAQNAERCAPRELAVAEANLDFARLELDQGDSGRAEEHLTTAQAAARKALADSKECGPIQVMIREPTALKVALLDRDGDGVPDNEDRCPDVPGPKENQGCPWPKDTDGDGVPDEIDKCPTVPGPKENFGCPWPDRDGDGVPDKDDKCPDTPGPKENHGCPWPDRDGDGVPDKDDRCPDEPGPKENFGCPWPDRDHDGVPDKDDKCPDEPGPADNFGCPRKLTLIIVRRDHIELKQQVHFASGKSRILPDSFELLRQVASAIKDVPAIRVRVEGHTDNVGGMDMNMGLSQDRADSVKAFLVKQGVEPNRLVGEGYGPTRPLKPNSSKKNRALNRRVEFRMIEEAKAPAPSK
jgi:outer membrane protein OmpA-like peptidoglycan-associated protein